VERFPWLLGAAVALYALWRSDRNPPRSDAMPRALSDDGGTRAPRRNATLVYRPVGGRGEPYPDWVRDLKGKAGVYLIRDIDTHELLYVGSSATQLYATLTRHFQFWRRWKGHWKAQYATAGRHDPGVTYQRDRVEAAVRITSPSDSLDEEARLIHRMRPRDNLIGQPDDEAGALEDAPF